MPAFFKQSAEIFPLGVNLVDILPSGTSISSVALSAIDLADSSDQTATVWESTTGSTSGTQALGRVRAGTHGHKYKLTFRVTLNSGDILEEDITMIVMDR
jgi:hypothetical protein